MRPAIIPRPNEQRKVEQLLLKLATIKKPISGKPAPIASDAMAIRIA